MTMLGQMLSNGLVNRQYGQKYVDASQSYLYELIGTYMNPVSKQSSTILQL